MMIQTLTTPSIQLNSFSIPVSAPSALNHPHVRASTASPPASPSASIPQHGAGYAGIANAMTSNQSATSTSQHPHQSNEYLAAKLTASILTSFCCKVIVAAGGLVAAYLAVSEAYATVSQGRAALSLARWTSHKDYLDECRIENVSIAPSAP